jgi:hypothetical protein
MTNLIKFSGRRAAPLPPSSPVDELTALEIELVRARLTQIRSETRQAPRSRPPRMSTIQPAARCPTLPGGWPL